MVNEIPSFNKFFYDNCTTIWWWQSNQVNWVSKRENLDWIYKWWAYLELANSIFDKFVFEDIFYFYPNSLP